ncbi:hypothetical protein [Pseudochelatococcus contaminans]|nr:hypothetical protein [Pseudochelatococcus contaminans]
MGVVMRYYNPDFADQAVAAVKRSAEALRKKTLEEKIEFLMNAGILGSDGKLLPQFLAEKKEKGTRKKHK